MEALNISVYTATFCIELTATPPTYLAPVTIHANVQAALVRMDQFARVHCNLGEREPFLPFFSKSSCFLSILSYFSSLVIYSIIVASGREVAAVVPGYQLLTRISNVSRSPPSPESHRWRCFSHPGGKYYKPTTSSRLMIPGKTCNPSLPCVNFNPGNLKQKNFSVSK
jgi:hypothetical protein